MFGNTNNNTNTGGGLFGAANTNTGGGLFGNTNTNTNTGGGLFGTSTNNTNTGGGLFGNTNNNTNTGGGLFGTTNTNTNTNTGGGLFGSANNTTNTGGGLFGTSTNNTNTGGGLFGNTNTNTSGSLFGTATNTNTGGGLFGTSNTNTGGGLFGATNTNTSGGLFSSSNTNTGGGLFGNTTTNTGGGLFGTANTNTSGGLFGANNKPTNQTSLFNNTKPSGSLFSGGTSQLFNTPSQPSTLFGQQQQQPTSSSLFGTPSLQQPSSLFSQPTPSKPQQPLFQSLPLIINNEALNHYIFGIQNNKNLSEIITELQKDYIAHKEKTKTLSLDELNSDSNSDSYINEKLKEFKEFLQSKRLQNKNNSNHSDNSVSKVNESSSSLLNVSLSKSKSIYEPINGSELLKRTRRCYGYFKPKSHSVDISKIAESHIVSNLENSFNKHLVLEGFPKLSKKQFLPYMNITFHIEEPHRATFSLKVTKNSKFISLKTAICDALKEKNYKYKHIHSNSFFLLKRSSVVNETPILSDTTISDGDTLLIILKNTIKDIEGKRLD